MKALFAAIGKILLAPITRWQDHKARMAKYRIHYEREERKP